METRDAFLAELIEAVVGNLAVIESDKKQQFKEILKKIFIDRQKPMDAMGLGQDFIEYIYSHGYRLYNNGNYKKAREVFTMLGIFDPTDARFPLALGACRHRLKNYNEAVEAYYNSAVLNPETPLPWYYMYDCYIQLGLLDDAAICMQEVIKNCGDKEAFAKLKERSILMLDGLTASLRERTPIEQEQKASGN